MGGFAAPAMMIGSAVSAYGKIQAGKAEEKMYDAKASETLIQGDASGLRISNRALMF